MHKYRHAARFSAWYDNEGEPSTHNPFKKFRARPPTSPASQLESGLRHASSDNVVRSGEEQRRRRELNEGVGGIEHAASFPHSSSSTEHARTIDESIEEADAPEKPVRSNEPINVSQDVGDAGEDKPRQRRKFLGISRTPSPNDDESDKPVENKQKFTFVGQLKATIFNSWINILLIAAPVGIIVNYLHLDPRVIFVINFIAIVPLAAMLSYATEEIALRTGETIGGLLNATFGNAVELIVAILALVDNQVIIVQTSLIGSMLSNLLLVMGMCFFFGGINRIDQKFNVVVAQTASSLLALAAGSLIIPTAFHTWSGAGNNGIAPLSRGTSVILLLVYAAYLFFQLKSHAEIYNEPSEKTEKRTKKKSEGDAIRNMAQMGMMGANTTVGGQNDAVKLADPESEVEAPQLSIWVAILTLAVSTAFVALCAEYMVGSIDQITEDGGISKTFVGLILLPIVGNAAEHATAVTVAVKDKMDLAIGVAVGSSMQIALLVLPLIVVIGWIMGNTDMTLLFDGFQITVLFVSVLLVNYLIADGKSHWLEGFLLMTLYIIIAVAAWFYPSK